MTFTELESTLEEHYKSAQESEVQRDYFNHIAGREYIKDMFERNWRLEYSQDEQ